MSAKLQFRLVWLALCILLSACGRIGYDALFDSDDVGVPLVAPVSQWISFYSVAQLIVKDTALDSSGNHYLVAKLFGNSTIGTTEHVTTGLGDALLVSYAPDGSYRWSISFGSPGIGEQQFFSSVEVNDNGDVFVTGYYSEDTNFGGATLNAEGVDIVVASYSSQGAHLWSKKIGGAASENGLLVLDAESNIYIVGQFDGDTTLEGQSFVNQGGSDFFIMKLDSAGTMLCTRSYGGPGDEGGGFPQVVGDSLCYIGGTTGVLDLGGGTIDTDSYFHCVALTDGRYKKSWPLQNYVGYALFRIASDGSVYTTGRRWLERWSAEGQLLWSHPSDHGGSDIVFDSNGNVIVGGAFESLDLGDGVVHEAESAVLYDIALASYTPAGKFRWGRALGLTTRWAPFLEIDSNDQLYMSSWVEGVVDFGFGKVGNVRTSNGIVTKFSPGGAVPGCPTTTDLSLQVQSTPEPVVFSTDPGVQLDFTITNGGSGEAKNVLLYFETAGAMTFSTGDDVVGCKYTLPGY